MPVQQSDRHRAHVPNNASRNLKLRAACGYDNSLCDASDLPSSFLHSRWTIPQAWASTRNHVCRDSFHFFFSSCTPLQRPAPSSRCRHSRDSFAWVAPCVMSPGGHTAPRTRTPTLAPSTTCASTARPRSSSRASPASREREYTHGRTRGWSATSFMPVSPEVRRLAGARPQSLGARNTTLRLDDVVSMPNKLSTTVLRLPHPIRPEAHPIRPRSDSPSPES